MRRELLLGVVIALLGLVTSGGLLAQVTTTTVFGRVTDSTGSPLVGASVKATNKDTNLTRTTQSGPDGEYRIELLPVGDYSLEVTASGFKKFVGSGIVLEVNVPARVDAAMEIGELSQTVTVTGGAPLVNTTSAEVGRTVENAEVVNLPLVNRNVYQLLTLTPGVQYNSTQFGQPSIVLGYPEQRTLINGGVDGGAGSVSYYLDGGINMTGLRNTGNILPNPDAIQEFRVETNNYDAEYGKMSGGVINVITKSGTNDFHGSLFEFTRNNDLNANFWGSKLPQPPGQRNQFGGTVGGPIIKDKTFFFFSYQGLRQLNNQFLTGATVPTTAEAQGIFPSALPSQYTCTGNPNQLCPALLDPVAKELINALGSTEPFPTIPAPNSGASGWQGTVRAPFNADDFLVKVDHNLTSNQLLGVSYFETSGNSSTPPLNSTTLQPSGNVPWDIQQYTWRQQNLNLSDTWTASPKFVNQVWFTYTRNFGGRLNLPATSLGDLGSDFSIQGPKSLPQITVTGFFTGASAIAGPVAGTNFYSLRDVATYNHGRHSIAFGVEQSLDKDIQQTLLNNYGVFGFNSTKVTDSATSASVTVPALANFELGLPTSVSQDVPVTGYTNSWTTGLFVQDNFRIFPRFTLNLGLRWDIQTPPTDPENRGSSFEQGCATTCTESSVVPTAPPGALFVGDPGITRGIVPVRWHHISPRIGFAWDPFGDGKTSIRGAAGVFYSSVSGNEWNTTTNFEPFAIRYTLTNVTSSLAGSGATATPTGATLSCPYINLASSFGSTVTCPVGSSGSGLTGINPFPYVYNPANPAFLTPGGSFFGFAKNFQWPYTYQLNFSAQRQITRDFSVSAAYVGTLSHDLPFAQDINFPILTANATSASSSIVARRPIDNPTPGTTKSPFGTVLLAQSNQTASYNGLQVTAQKRMSQGFLVYAFYTFSKTFDSVQLDNNTTQGGAQNFDNLREERGPADFDIRHVFVASAVWQLNYYKGQSSFARGLLNGWSISPIINLHSGLPFTVLNGADANLSGNSASERAELVPGVNPVLDPHRSRSAAAAEWFNTAAFSQNCAKTTLSSPCVPMDGNSGRNMLRGPGFKDVDLAVFRDFTFKERYAIQARLESLNVFNMVSLNNPTGNGATAGSSTFGVITGAAQMRQLQFGLRFTF
jgi:hypothetical protein